MPLCSSAGWAGKQRVRQPGCRGSRHLHCNAPPRKPTNALAAAIPARTWDLLQVAAGKTWHINQEADDEARSQEHGVVFGDGDGTVPLLSLGYACGGPWRTRNLNPAGMKVCSCCCIPLQRERR